MAESPERLRHSVTVWERARAAVEYDLGWLSPERAGSLVLAALLHDAGRSLDPADTEPHGFVGARLLDAAGLADVAPLVAHHSGARFEAGQRGLSHLDRWAGVDRDLLGVLTYLDHTTTPDGDETSLADRRQGLVQRYGPASLNVVMFDLSLTDVERGRALLRRRQARTG
jgi:hypothetical protein